MKELEKYELIVIEGGSTNPTYDVSDNYNAAVWQAQTVGPTALVVAVDLVKTFAYDILKSIFL